MLTNLICKTEMRTIVKMKNFSLYQNRAVVRKSKQLRIVIEQLLFSLMIIFELNFNLKAKNAQSL